MQADGGPFALRHPSRTGIWSITAATIDDKLRTAARTLVGCDSTTPDFPSNLLW